MISRSSQSTWISTHGCGLIFHAGISVSTSKAFVGNPEKSWRFPMIMVFSWSKNAEGHVAALHRVLRFVSFWVPEVVGFWDVDLGIVKLSWDPKIRKKSWDIISKNTLKICQLVSKPRKFHVMSVSLGSSCWKKEASSTSHWLLRRLVVVMINHVCSAGECWRPSSNMSPAEDLEIQISAFWQSDLRFDKSTVKTEI